MHTTNSLDGKNNRNSITFGNFDTPGVVATIRTSRTRWKLARQSHLTVCRAAGRVDYWPTYERQDKGLTPEEIGQELGGN